MLQQGIFKKLLPHILVIAAFFALSLTYFSPLLDGKKIQQGDIVHWLGTAKETIDHREKYNEEPLWTNSLFGGMPTYQLSTLYPSNWSARINHFLDQLFVNPASYLFLSMLGFYILALTFNVSIPIAFMGAVGYGLATYFMVSLEAGHNSKVNAIGYMAPVISGVLLAYRGKYWLGFSITALALSLQVASNHLQITYYLAYAIVLIVLVHLVVAIKEKSLINFTKASAFLFVAAILAVLPNITNILVTSEYGKYTTRGPSELTSNKENKTTGLDKDYATAWSYGVSETFNLMIPNFKGGESGAIGKNEVALKNVDPNFKPIVSQLDQYFGNQPFTAGPTYMGAIFVFLFVLALFFLDGAIKWWIIAATLLSVILAWGKHFMPLTEFFLDYVPGYNKFRTVSMNLVVANITIPLAGILVLKKIIDNPSILTEKIKWFYVAFALTGGLCLLMYLMPDMFNTFLKDGEYESLSKQLADAGWPANQQADLLDNLQLARKNIFTADALRSFFLITLAAALIWLFVKNKISSMVLGISLSVLVLGDLWLVDKRYVNNESFVSAKLMDKPIQPNAANLAILQDNDPNFRVFNLTVNPFSDATTSYFHKSIGGYHAAKLKRYQELIEYHLSKNNMRVLNMLNTKYFIVPGPDKQPMAQRNYEALGNAWPVKQIKWVKNADEEIEALNEFSPATEAVIDERFKSQLEGKTFGEDSSATIILKSYKPNELVYEYNGGTSNQFVVFSEIYYDKGWDAYIDGAPADYVRCNYVLRGMLLPEGKHEIVFKFYPKSYHTGEKIALAGSILLLLLAGFGFFKEIKSSKAD
ncbi:MAG: YfhO family protein [Bacteroidia bacterium]